MKELTREQTESAVARLVQLIELRGIKQEVLAANSGMSQSTISKIMTGSKDLGSEKYIPSEDVLKKLFNALGLKLNDILNESDRVGENIYGYLATPLTGLSPAQDAGLRKVVQKIREVAANPQFSSPPFEIYWPGDVTHPTLHADIPASQVYITDRTRASTHDFIVLFCGTPSYGVGQENEIATQAGVPAIRLVPEKLSRMMLGSFASATDITFSGTLETGISFDSERLRQAMAEIRQTLTRIHAFYRGINGDAFGTRLRGLINDRCGGDEQFAHDLGISNGYLQSLIGESLAVSNPSIVLLKRMAHRLNERVSYLVGDSEENDPVLIESYAAFHSWIQSDPEIRAGAAYAVRDEWKNEYALRRRDHAEMSLSSHRRPASAPMKSKDWDIRYRKHMNAGASGVANEKSTSLFQ
jgi:transcriptional regulator with XRE-family HTH domain